MASTITSQAASAPFRSGAKPPSSPTAVENFRSLRIFLRLWNTSAPARSASRKVGSPSGTIMNSWKSRALLAWAPPLMMFISGTGSTRALGPPRYL